ncbi:MAG TPA: hypothetical protein ENK91_04055 [Bacteroidetes bacterium]|nr:hypothetical protein [Bacteroidota bacterium]
MNSHFNKFIIVIFLLILWGNTYCQDSKKLNISTFVSVQKADDRHIGVSEPMLKLLNQWNSEMNIKGTIHYGIEIGYKIFDKNKYQIESKVGWSQEVTSFHRIFNQSALGNYTEILLSMDKYHYDLINLGFDFKYNIANNKNHKIHTGFSLNSFYRYRSYYRSRKDYYWDKKDFLSLELNPKIGIYYKNIDLDFYYRLFQLRKIDRALFKKSSGGYGGIKNDYEIYNPLKFGISVKYWLDI